MIIKAKKFFLPFLLSIVLVSLLIFLILPKFLLLDQLIQKNGIYMIPKSVKEGVFRIELEDTLIYDRNYRIGKFKKLDICFAPFYLAVNAKDLSGFFEIKYYFLSKRYLIKAKDLSSFEKFHIKEANIDLKNDIKGQAKLQNIKISGTDIDFINIIFKEKTFDITLQGKEINSRGSGIIVIDNKSILDSKLTGEVIDKNMKIIVSGSIKNITFQLQPTF